MMLDDVFKVIKVNVNIDNRENELLIENNNKINAIIIV